MGIVVAGERPLTTVVASTAEPVASIGSPGLVDKIAYGFGSIAFGIKDNGFNVLLLLFYNQALGLPAKSVGLAILIAIVADVVFDPLLGNWSDNLRSRLGRRHPFMYAAALPVSVSYYFLWNPPRGLHDGSLMTFLIVISIITRLCISLYEVPSTALISDLTTDYDERTSFFSYRYFFGWVGGLTMGVAAFSVFLRPSAQDPLGQLNLQGYSNYGLVASLLMFAAIIISSLGTQRRAAAFPKPPLRPPLDFRRTAREVYETLSNFPFVVLFVSGIFSFAGLGIAEAIRTYFRIYFWELSGDQISLLLGANFASLFVALAFAPWFGRKLGKKRANIVMSLVYLVLAPSMYLGRLFDLVPANGTSLLFAMLFVQSFFGSIILISLGVMGAAMMADVVEDSARRTGRHSAGLFFSTNTFMLKSMSGVGVFGGGLILDWVGFPKGAKVGGVPQAVLDRLAVAEPVVVFTLTALALLCVLAYPITRRRHEDNLAALRAAATRMPPFDTLP